MRPRQPMAKKNNPKPVILSPQAKEDIINTLTWLSENWNQKVIDEFLQKLEIFYQVVLLNPKIFGYYDKRKNIRKYSLTSQNIIYYRNRRNAVEVITVFDARQNPQKLKILLK